MIVFFIYFALVRESDCLGIATNYDCYSCFSLYINKYRSKNRYNIQQRQTQIPTDDKNFSHNGTTSDYQKFLSPSLNYSLSTQVPTRNHLFFKNLSVHNDHGAQQTLGTNSRCLIKLGGSGKWNFEKGGREKENSSSSIYD